MTAREDTDATESKPWNPDRLFARIQSPREPALPTEQYDVPSEGWGYECGCCDPERDIAQGILFAETSTGEFAAVVLGGVAAGAALGAGAALIGSSIHGPQAALGAGDALLGGRSDVRSVAGLAGSGAAMGAPVFNALRGPTGAVLDALGRPVMEGLNAIFPGDLGPPEDSRNFFENELPHPSLEALALGGGAVGLVGSAIGILYTRTTVVKKFAQTIPSWVYAKNSRRTEASPEMAAFTFTELANEEEQELEGELAQSFQTWTDVPVYQWHRYFDWNFYVRLAPGHRHRVSKATAHHEGHVPEIECEWDTGAISKPPAGGDPDLKGYDGTYNAAMFRGKDLAWPMLGQRIWMAGRWVFDCGHGAPRPEAEQPSRLQSKRFRLELHPLKAFASARTEGVSFNENQGHYVPGVRWVFVASRHGGYYEFPRLDQRDYVFLVDLPKYPSAHAMHWTTEPCEGDLAGSQTLVGHSRGTHLSAADGTTPLAARRTRLLLRAVTEPFRECLRGSFATIQPRIEPVIPEDGSPPCQVKVTIPLTTAGNADCYGVILEMGWLDDADFSLARTVRRFDVTFHRAKVLNARHNVPGDFPLCSENGWADLANAVLDLVPFFSLSLPVPEEWRLRFGVNGRWAQTPQTSLTEGKNLSLDNQTFTVYLAPDDDLTVCCHGTEHDKVEDLFEEKRQDRLLKVNNAPLGFDDIFRCTDNERRRTIANEFYAMNWTSFADTSDPLGRYASRRKAHEFEDGAHLESGLAYALVEDHRMAETRENSEGVNDYELVYVVKVNQQRLPGRP